MEDLKQKWQKEIASRLLVIKIVLLIFVVSIFCRLIYIQLHGVTTLGIGILAQVS